MSKRVKISWGVTHQSGTETVSLEDLGLTEAEWDALSREEKEEKLQDYLDNLPERTSIVVDEFSEL